MNKLISILFCILSYSCFTQNIQDFNSKNFEWKIKNINEVFLKKHINDNILPYDIEANNYTNIIKNFYLIDVNNDSINELIYDGWNGSEGEVFIIYTLKNNHYKRKIRW